MALVARRLAIVAAGLGLIAAAPAEVAEPGYLIDLTLYDGDRLIGTPSLKVTESEPSAMMVDMADGYAVKLAIDSVEEGGEADVSMEISLRSDGEWLDAGSRRIVARLGQTASMQYAHAPNGLSGPLKLTMRAIRVESAAASAAGAAVAR